MPIVISENGQIRVRNSYQSSAQCRLTLRVNGEDAAVVITDSGEVVPAGFDAPTVTPVAAVGAGGTVPVGFYVYRYVYASSRYPFVENAVTGGGDQWPRSSPSPASNTINNPTVPSIVTVTGAYTTRSDVDSIWMYRTSVQTTQALAEALSEAGRLFYVGRIANITSGGAFTYTDNAQVTTSEPLELDNYTCPLFRQSVFDGFQWWGWGNKTLKVVVLLNDTTTITATSGTWGDGRNGPPSSISFLGITTGGYDGRGNFYFQASDSTTAQIFNSEDMTSPVVLSATGLTTAYLSAPSTTLYKSKQLNPFSWGITDTTFIPNTSPQQTQFVPSLFAEQIGGGNGTAISLVPNERILKLDTEAPERSYALDLNAANSSDFIGTLRTLDDAQSVSSQFSQFAMRQSDGQSVGTGINAKALQILQGDAQSQIPIGGPVVVTLRQMVRTGEIPSFFHGVYDRNLELNCWWVKINPNEAFTIDTLLYQHAPTGTWGMKHTPGVNASWTAYDPTDEEYYTFVGTSTGLIGTAFTDSRFVDFVPVVTQTATFSPQPFPTGSTLTVPFITQIIEINFTYNPNVATVTPSVSSGLQTGDLIQIVGDGQGLEGPAYSIYNVSDSSFQFAFTGTPTGPIFQGVVIPAVFAIPSVVSLAGFGMFYLIPSQRANGIIAGSTVSFPLTAYSLQNIYDYSDGGALPDSVDGYPIYIGGIPCFLRRYYNSSTPETQKQQVEWYGTMLNANTSTGALLIKWYSNYDQTASSQNILPLEEDVNQDGSPSPLWFMKDPPSDLTPTIGVEVLEIGTLPYEIMDVTLKQQPC